MLDEKKNSDMSPELKDGKKEDDTHFSMATQKQFEARNDGQTSSIDVLLDGNTTDACYAHKAALLNQKIQEMGHGRYQVWLFFVIGLGYSAENWLLILTSLILTPVANEFHPSRAPYLTLAQNIGLLAGAAFWSPASDIVGRRLAFNSTFLVIAIFAVVAGSSPNFASICIFDALWSFGVGGGLPVDTAIYLEWLPASHQYLLTALCVWWSVAQVIVSLIAYAVLGNLSCSQAQAAAFECDKSNNYGWRAMCFITGGIWFVLWLIRFLFPLKESPKWLMSRGRDAEAVETVHFIAKFNKTTTDLRVEDFEAIDRQYADEKDSLNGRQDLQATANVKRSLAKFNASHLRELFCTRKQGFTTGLLSFIWLAIGLAYPLYNQFIPYYLATRFTSESSTSRTYRDTLLVAVAGIPGVILGAYLVEKRLGRKGVLAICTVLSGVWICASTTATSSNILLGWNILFSFWSAGMYAVLFAITPEIFPTRVRGTGNGLTAAFNRIGGVIAPVIAFETSLDTSTPVFVAGAVFIVAGLSVILLPFEPRGRASL